MKRMVWNAVSTRKVEAVKDACSFASVANKLSTSVAVTFVGSKELEATADLLRLKKFFSVAPVIPGTVFIRLTALALIKFSPFSTSVVCNKNSKWY